MHIRYYSFLIIIKLYPYDILSLPHPTLLLILPHFESSTFLWYAASHLNAFTQPMLTSWFVMSFHAFDLSVQILPSSGLTPSMKPAIFHADLVDSFPLNWQLNSILLKNMWLHLTPTHCKHFTVYKACSYPSFPLTLTWQLPCCHAFCRYKESETAALSTLPPILKDLATARNYCCQTPSDWGDHPMWINWTILLDQSLLSLCPALLC